MKAELISILEQYVDSPNDVFLQGTLNAESAYPQKFITFFTTNSDLDAFYSNDPNRIVWYISVIFYSNDPQEVADVPKELIRDLRNAGFQPQGVGFDIPSDDHDYTGWSMEFIYVEETSNYEQGE